MIKAGTLRHRVDIEEPVKVQDPSTGEITLTWRKKFTNVPAAIEPLSVRETLMAQQVQSEVAARIVLRFREGLAPTQRIRHGKKVYLPAGFLTDKESGLEYVTLPCALGAGDGD